MKAGICLLPFHLPVSDFFRSLYKKSIPASRIIELASLEESREVLFRDLSGGQQQRLSVALAFVNDPDIIFLDEPTTGLYPQARRAVWEVIETFRRAEKTVLLTTHYQPIQPRAAFQLP